MVAPIIAMWRHTPKFRISLDLDFHYGDVIMGAIASHQPHDCLLNCLFRRRSKKTSKLRVTGLCAGNSPGNDEFPVQLTSGNAENVSIWWRHHALCFSSIPRWVRYDALWVLLNLGRFGKYCLSHYRIIYLISAALPGGCVRKCPNIISYMAMKRYHSVHERLQLHIFHYVRVGEKQSMVAL